MKGLWQWPGYSVARPTSGLDLSVSVVDHGVLSGIQQVQKCRVVGSSDQGGSSGESELLDES